MCNKTTAQVLPQVDGYGLSVQLLSVWCLTYRVAPQSGLSLLYVSMVTTLALYVLSASITQSFRNQPYRMLVNLDDIGHLPALVYVQLVDNFATTSSQNSYFDFSSGFWTATLYINFADTFWQKLIKFSAWLRCGSTIFDYNWPCSSFVFYRWLAVSVN